MIKSPTANSLGHWHRLERGKKEQEQEEEEAKEKEMKKEKSPLHKMHAQCVQGCTMDGEMLT